MEALGGGDAESQFQEELAYMADKFYHMSVAELLKKVPEEALRDQVFRNRAVGSMDRETMDKMISALLYEYPFPELENE